jgi:hypothetical protein
MDGIPDDVKYVAPTLKFERRPTEQQNKASAQLTVMQSAAPILDAYSQKQAPGYVTSFLKSAKTSTFAELIANPLLKEEDRQFLQAGRQFVDAWTRAVSGAQTNETEFARILKSTIETVGDDPNTREQKRNMRSQMILAVQDISSGTMTRGQVFDRLLRQNWNKDQMAILRDAQKKAMKFEADMKMGKVQIDPTSPPPSSPEQLQDNIAEIAAALAPLLREP